MNVPAGWFRVAIVGAATLKGKELKDVLGERNFPAADTCLLDDDESLGQLDAVGDEVTFIQSILPEHFDKVDFAFFASEGEFTRRNWKLAKQAGAAIVDLSYALEDEPGSVVRAPWIEHELGTRPQPELESATTVIAHPAAVVLGLLLLRAQKMGAIRSAATTVFEPASEHGRRGMDELHEQTVNLLSFQQLPKNVFDSQVAFNIISRYGEKSASTVESVERRVLGHYKKIVGGRAPVPSLMLLQAPIFHAHGFSVYIELDKRVSLGDFTQALAGEHVTITRLAEDSPSNVNAAGQDDVLVTLRRDVQHENGFWLWATADNLRLAAQTAVDCAAALAASRPQGKVQ
ncbi:MAG: segregation protein B [Acidobacteriia bacterium]|nr:segregation protein B [Terriglobia bacterium]